MLTWEYKIVHFQADKLNTTGLPKDIGTKFDVFGSQGWELVGTEAIQRPRLFLSGATTVGMVAFFKRPKGS